MSLSRNLAQCKPKVYDVSALEHPEPLEIMTSALKEAREGKLLLMIHRREPFPLYEIIKAQNLHYHTHKIGERFYIFIGQEKSIQGATQESALEAYLVDFLNNNTKES